MVHLGLAPRLITQAANLYDLELRHHYGTVLPCKTQRIRLWQRLFNPQFALCYQIDHELVGIAGFSCLAGSFTGGCSIPCLIRTVGLRKTLLLINQQPAIKRPPSAVELVQNGLVVHPKWRRRGVARQLLEALAHYAHQHGFERIRLDVERHNIHARQLYDSTHYVAARQIPADNMLTLYRYL